MEQRKQHIMDSMHTYAYLGLYTSTQYDTHIELHAKAYIRNTNSRDVCKNR